VTDKSWKLRKEAYSLLRALLADRLKNGEGNGSIHGDTLMPGLDDALPSMVSDKNAGALDTALAFAVDYAEHCNGASSSELAAKIVASTIKGGALSSSKPSTSKSASALALKLMEVGDEGYASVHAVSEVLLSQGMSSRKPKIVIASSGLILQAAYDFGAGSLPLAAISSAAPKMLSHSNATVRETGLKIIAEICRALKSKAPLQGLIDGMKKAQQSQLESMLEAQPEPTPIGIGLRSMKGSNSSQSPADALAALESGAKELEAKRFAEREPVNLLQALPKTDYSTRIKLAKWSEKVGALDIALECGGEKPYKLVQPSSSVNYSPLISEMKGLLSHSHFAVASKAMKVLSMLAEGVGSGLFPHLRPLLRQLILLSKDKKLNRAVNESLDIFFGNVLEIDHLLDKDDALPSVLNEKVQKNALVRATALDFLGRCIKRGESAGPRGRITSKSAAAVARLCCEKLEDSDASVRKAATETLRCLLSVEDAAITDAVSPIIESLQSKNSRAYKSLVGGGGAGQRRGGPSGTASVPKSRASGSRQTQPGPAKSSPQAGRKVSRPSPIEQTATKQAASRTRPVPSSSRGTSAPESVVEDSSDAPSLDEAISVVASVHVPSWDSPEDDGGVFAGLKCKLPSC
jgi:cytoskeleton-associated protein 5